MTVEQDREKTVDILQAIWNSVDWQSFPQSLRVKVYDLFASRIKSAALTSSLPIFVETLCKKMGVRSISNEKIVDVIKDKKNNALLKLFREETALLVLMMRERNGALKNV